MIGSARSSRSSTGRPAELHAIGARPGDRSDGDAALGMVAIRCRRCARATDTLTGWPARIGTRSSRIFMPASSSMRTTRRRPVNVTLARTSRSDGAAHVEAYGRYLSRNAGKDEALENLSGVRQSGRRSPADRRRDERKSRRARSCRHSSTRRRPAPPRRYTGSAPRSDAAAAKIWR